MPKSLHLISFGVAAFLKYGGPQNSCNESVLALACAWGQ